MNKNLKFFLLLLLICRLGYSQEETKDYSLLTSKQIDTIDFNGYSVEKYKAVFNQAEKLKNDSVTRFKGSVIMSVLADSFRKDLKNELLNPKERKVKYLISQFEKNQYLVYQPKPSNFIKLMYYLCNFKQQSNHIKNRFYTSIFFIPTIIVFVVFIVFTLLNLLDIIKWRHKRKYYKFLLASLILVIIMSIIFNQTCDQYVKKDSFYGIPL